MLEKYLNDIKDMEESTKELQYRGALEWLLNAIKEALNVQNMQIIHEPPNDKGGKGAPDFWILKNGLTLGYIENKRVNENLEKIAQSEQIAKYLNLSENLMICDYLEFAIVALEEGKAKIINCFRICDLCDLKTLNLIALEQKQAELLEFFKLFYNKNPKPIVKALEFAEVLAQRTRILNYYLFLNFDNDYIQGTFKILKRVLYKDLKIDDFCDSFAQTLTYTLFLARLNNKTQEKITLENIKRFIPRVFELLRDLSGFLNNLYEVEPNDKQDSNRAYHLKLLLNEIITIINNINVAELEKELNQIREKDLEGNYLHKDPYLHFYETFLKKYDYELRIVRGVYYTPAPVVGFIINSIDLILQKDFNKKAGLKEAKRQDSNIRLLDFATGTGTFLLEAFRKTLESTKPTNEKGHKRLEYDNEIKSVVDKFYGFEFLIAPYVIAHLKISQELKESFEFDLDKKYKEYKEQYKKPIRLNIVLTDTLYSASEIDEINKNYTLFAGGLSLAKEFEKACDIKNEEILIITGNPPYNALSQNKYDIEAYKYCGLKSNSENSKISINERKHRLNDDYIKFIRFAESKIQKQQQGIFAIISNNSFIDAGTMRGMRWNLLNTFDEIYILNLHGDNNKKETCPDGSPDVNVFDIKQGVSINIFIKTKPKEVKFSNTPKCKVYYYDLYGTRHYKYSFLSENTLKTIKWQNLKPKFPKYEFFPQDNEAKKQYDKGISVKEIFMKNGLGICTYRDKFCYANSSDEIKNRIEIFSKQDISENRKYFNLPQDSRDWTIQGAKDELVKTGLNENFIKQVHFKPFDFKYTYYTGKSKGFLGCPAGAIQDNMLQDNLGLICYRTCGVSGLDNIFIANGLIDLHLVGSGSSLFPLYLYKQEAKKGEQDSMDEKSENFTQDFRDFIDSKYGEHFSAEVILGYIYAVLFHKGYREKYIDFLKVDFPKVPFVESKSDFLKLSKLGSALIELHLMQTDLSEVSVGSAVYKNDRDNVIKKISYKTKEKEIFVNDSLYFERVEKAVWEYKIGGYAVCEKYLKSHKGETLDFTHFSKIIKTLHKTLEIESKIAKISGVF